MELDLTRKTSKKESFVLVFSIFIAGLCSIVYELLIGTTSSYFLGDSVRQFSITIGFYMASMGLGSYVSRYFEKNLLSKFICVEILLGFIGGISVPVLYLVFSYTDFYQYFMFLFIISIGFFIGLEIPLLTRLMENYYTLKVNISNILSLDYFGALVATLIFPFILLPYVGVFKSSLIFGIVNMSIGFVNLWAFSDTLNISKQKIYLYASILVTTFLVFLVYASQFLLSSWENDLYEDQVIYSKQTPYQRIVLTKNKEDIRLFLNGGLQFSSIDEYRYHESLIHIPLSSALKKSRVLVLGGGDGLAIRELLKYKEIEEIVLVDLDPEIINIATKNPHVKIINQNSFASDKVKIQIEDAFIYLKNNIKKFDIIIADLPDPSNVSTARLYSIQFFKLVKNNLITDGVFATQATSPFFANSTFWCIKRTIERAGFKYAYPYHVHIPSFSEWGFVMAANRDLSLEDIKIRVSTKFLDDKNAKNIFVFDKDIRNNEKTVSSLESPEVLNYYLDEWKYWN